MLFVTLGFFSTTWSEDATVVAGATVVLVAACGGGDTFSYVVAVSFGSFSVEEVFLLFWELFTFLSLVAFIYAYIILNIIS